MVRTCRGLRTAGILLAFLLVAPARAQVVYVDDDSPGGGGSSWDDAFPFLQDALLAAQSGDEVWVAGGTYRPDDGEGITPGDRFATFSVPDDVRVYGGFAGTETQLAQRDVDVNPTILSGDLAGNDIADLFPGDANLGENSLHVITLETTSRSTRLDGFTVRGGNANMTGSTARGGGLLSQGAAFTLANCTFERNRAHHSSPIGSGFGGAVALDGGTPTLERCTFDTNAASGQPTSFGGALYANGASPRVVRCTFIDNTSQSGAAAHLLGAGSATVFTNCRFLGNTATVFGGAVTLTTSATGTFINCAFSGNSAGDSGGAVSHFATGLVSRYYDCTFTNNVSTAGGAIHSGSPLLINSILWNDTPDEISTSGSTNVSYSIVEGGFAGTAVLDANPLLADPLGLDGIAGTRDDRLLIRNGSPAIDAGSNVGTQLDSDDLDGDGIVFEATPLDLGERPRFVDDTYTVDTGAGFPPVVDIGAHESAGGPGVLYVNQFNLGNINDGTSWATAYTSVQSALDFAGTTGAGMTWEVWVAAGRYTPDVGPGQTPGDRTATFQMRDNAWLYGGFAGTETVRTQRDVAANETTLSGDLLGDDVGGLFDATRAENSFHIVTGTGTTAAALLDGFTVASGQADGTGPFGGGLFSDGGDFTIRTCHFTLNVAGGDGGAIYSLGLASPTIADTRFTANHAVDNGGAVYGSSNTGILTGCTFTANAVQNNAGGAVYMVGGSPDIIDTVFSGNSSPNCGGGIALVAVDGGIVRGCTFTGNSALVGGGLCDGGSVLTVSNTVFLDNHATVFGGGSASTKGSEANYVSVSWFGNTTEFLGGGSATTAFSSNTYTNCLFSGNVADSGGSGARGGGLAVGNADAVVTNCTFAGNSAEATGGGISNESGSGLAVANSILWDNADASGLTETAQVSTIGGAATAVDYSILRGLSGGLGGTGNLGLDPEFVNAAGTDGTVGTGDDDLHLASLSPAIDAGNTPVVPADVADLDGDGNTAERTPLDRDGNQRQYDHPGVTDTGIPGSPVVDLGGFEFSDCNNNGIPDADDIAAGTSGDCDGDGIPDECEIAFCTTPPDCGDCNINGVPDVCDIAAGTSDDLNGDAIPDECTQFIGGCGPANPEWSCVANWSLGGVFPNNIVGTRYSVILDALDDVFLDLDITIDSLWLTGSAVLRLTQTGPGADLVLDTHGLLAESTILVAHDNNLTAAAPASCTFLGGGAYRPDPAAIGPITATLTCGTVDLFAGGEIRLGDAMDLIVNSNLRIDGTPDCPLCGGKAPPILGKPGSGDIVVRNDVILRDNAGLDIGPQGGIAIGGDLINHSVAPALIDLAHAFVQLGGSGVQHVEVAGQDIGATLDGFTAGAGSNFAVGILEVAATPTQQIVFENHFANTVGTGPCAEALYVHELRLLNGPDITLDNVRVYYETLVQSPSTVITSIGCGALVQIPACGTTADCDDGNVCFHPSCGPPCSYQWVAYGDVDGSGGAANLDDILCVLDGFSDPAACPLGDLAGPASACERDGLIDLFDITAVMNAFAGGDPCSCAAP